MEHLSLNSLGKQRRAHPACSSWAPGGGRGVVLAPPGRRRLRSSASSRPRPPWAPHGADWLGGGDSGGGGGGARRSGAFSGRGCRGSWLTARAEPWCSPGTRQGGRAGGRAGGRRFGRHVRADLAADRPAHPRGLPAGADPARAPPALLRAGRALPGRVPGPDRRHCRRRPPR